MQFLVHCYVSYTKNKKRNNNQPTKKKKKQSSFNITTIFILLLSIYTIAINNNSVLSNNLTNNKVLYIDNSGKLATSEIEENSLNKLNKIDTIESNITTIQQQLDGKQGSVIAGTGITITNNTINVNLDDLKTQLLNLIYPIGSIYITIGNTNPSSTLGGSWSQVGAGYALWSATSDAGGTISAGLPNISGWVDLGVAQGTGHNMYNSSGVFTRSSNGQVVTDYNKDEPYIRGSGTSRLNFSANNSNSIYGNSSTVQPPAYKVYVWRRTS